VQARFVELKGDFAGLCAIVQMAMAMIEVCRERGFQLRAGLAYGWELAANLHGVDAFSEQEMQRLMELQELQEMQQQWCGQGLEQGV
jgi:hypothetical protein